LGAPPSRQAHAVSRATDKLDIFAADVNGNILTSAWEPGFTQWRPWRQVAGGTTIPGGHVTAVSRSADKLDIFAVGLNHGVYTAAWEPDFGPDWHGWWAIGDAPFHAASHRALPSTPFPAAPTSSIFLPSAATSRF
jgi:hypothetical protein